MKNKQKVLIVDDEPRNQRIMTEILEDIVDFQVASSGEEALKALASYSPDVVMLDIMMPGIDGYEVCRQIRANPHLAFTKIILVSGKAMTEERLKGYEVGADEYMTKPFVPEELLAKARVFLRLTATERELAEINRSLDERVQEQTQQLLQAEASLIQSAKMTALGEMAGGIAHEINTPLGVISLASDQLNELINEEKPNLIAVKEMTKAIDDTVQRISKIIQGLRNFSRDGSQDLLVPIPLKEIIADTLGLCSEKIKNAQIQIDVGDIADELLISCQPSQLAQVFLNLINNACDAVRPLKDRWLKISFTAKQDRVQISLIDSGPGIPLAIREKLFQPFFTTKGIGSGTGLGLSISKGIIKSHNGTLKLNSESPNTRFDIELPIARSLDTQVSKAAT
jgi:C4-dicarboxylate-specific signal transduction histidine kinase